MFHDIRSSKNWASVEPLNKGWSTDKKYRIVTTEGEHLILRMADIEKYDAKKKEYGIIQKYSNLGFQMSMPLEFGVCNDNQNVYMLLTWLDGRDLESVLPELPEKEQYQLGRRAGEILKRIHSVKLDDADIPTRTKQEKKLFQLARYEESVFRLPNDETAIKYVKENIDQIWKVPPVYMHGDYHPGNLIYLEDGTIGVIDFNRWEVGDPYEEFYKLESFGTECSIPYCVGQIDAYFGDEIPEDFWTTNAIYVAHASLFSIKWAEKFGRQDIDGMVVRAKRAFENFEDFRIKIPHWYTNKYRTHYVDSESCR